MKLSEFNTVLREVIIGISEQGFKKKPICDVTLGQQAYPQFEKFLKGADLGVKPLERFLEGLGFELHLTPILKSDSVWKENVDNKIMDEFVPTIQNDLKEYLGVVVKTSQSTTTKFSSSPVIKQDVLNILDQL